VDCKVSTRKPEDIRDPPSRSVAPDLSQRATVQIPLRRLS
jgi:hypothetical protein